MALDVRVLAEKEALLLFGNDCLEMRKCEDCGTRNGVFVVETNRADTVGFNRNGERFDYLVWERWRCVNCCNIWTEIYGVRK